MYKSSGKKYKGSSRDASSGKYRTTSGYSSDVIYRSDDDEDDELYSPRMYGGRDSPESYYSTGKTGYGTSGKSSNYYGSKSHDYYPTSKSDYYHGGSGYGKHKGSKEPAYKMNKYQTIVLKVQIHCDACIRKVKKAIAEIDGVESISVDQKQKKVTVTGYLDPKKVLKKVSKTGKSVELVGSKDPSSSMMSNLNHHNNMNNKAALIMAASSNPHLAAHSNKQTPYTISVEKSSRSHPNNASTMMHMPPAYIHMTPQVRSDVDYMFSDDNANSCSIM